MSEFYKNCSGSSLKIDSSSKAFLNLPKDKFKNIYEKGTLLKRNDGYIFYVIGTKVDCSCLYGYFECESRIDELFDDKGFEISI